MEIGFFGAAGTVTGSKFFVHDGGTRILIDCGMFQGLKELRLLNWSDFVFDPKSIDAVVLTHAHLDHCGLLPILVRSGFKGPIYCSRPTADLTKVILLDSAKIQEEDAEYANKKGFSKHHPALALYNSHDVQRTLPLLEPKEIHEEFIIGDLKIKFFTAGHILGATSVLVSNKIQSVYFSGDIGRTNDPLMWPPEPPPDCDYIVMESTYGDREHSMISSREILKDCILDIWASKGVLLIPSFAVGRAQNLVYEIIQLKRSGEVPPISVYFNTPMGIEVSQFYEDHPTFHRLGPGQFELFMQEVQTIKTAEESKQLNLKKGPMVIIAASGMLTGGRILHHLKAFGSDPQNHILLPGFQSPGTRGWSLVNGSTEIKAHGAYMQIKSKVIFSDSFSAHADRKDLLNWLQAAEKKPKKIFLVHGENTATDELRRRIKDQLQLEVAVPKLNEIINLLQH